MRVTRALSCVILALLLRGAAGAADATYSSDYRYVDGTIAHAENACAAADLCATLSLRRGDVISVYAEVTLGCEPPTLHVVRRRGTQTIVSYQLVPQLAERRQASKTPRAATYGCHAGTAYVTLDRGFVRMGVFPVGDGTLFVRFTGGSAQAGSALAPATLVGP